MKSDDTDRAVLHMLQKTTESIPQVLRTICVTACSTVHENCSQQVRCKHMHVRWTANIVLDFIRN